VTDRVISTMQDGPLTIRGLLRHGERVFAGERGADLRGRLRARGDVRRGRRPGRAAGRRAGRLGVQQGDRVGTFLWNTQEHLEAYFAVPSMGAVLHTLNLRLFPEQLAYVIDHGQDRVVIVDATVLPLLAKVADQIPTVEHYVLVGDGRHERARRRARVPLRGPARRGAGDVRLARAGRALADGDVLHERHDRQPQGRRLQPPLDRGCTRWRHLSGNVLGLTEHDSVLPVVPMFHAAAWGLAYSGWLAAPTSSCRAASCRPSRWPA
jgi:fatty-acyl-CoA synthase